MAKVTDLERRQLEDETNERVKLDGKKDTMMRATRTSVTKEVSQAEISFKAECGRLEAQLNTEKQQIEGRGKVLSDQIKVLTAENQRLAASKRNIAGGGDLGDIERELNEENERLRQECMRMTNALEDPATRCLNSLQKAIEDAVNAVAARSADVENYIRQDIRNRQGT